jgi:hypothetical protein
MHGNNGIALAVLAVLSVSAGSRSGSGHTRHRIVEANRPSAISSGRRPALLPAERAALCWLRHRSREAARLRRRGSPVQYAVADRSTFEAKDRLYHEPMASHWLRLLLEL